MSKLRDQVESSSGEIQSPAEGDLAPFVVFTQLKKDGPFIYAGWLEAPDRRMALTLAIQHYGRDQVCAQLQVAPREFVGGMRENADAAEAPVAEARDYQIFTQASAGDPHVSSVIINARSAADAIRAARRTIEGGYDLHNLWAIPCEEIACTDETMLIWKNIDQSYRLARGYSRDVREKWEQIRGEKDLDEYERDDLKESF